MAEKEEHEGGKQEKSRRTRTRKPSELQKQGPEVRVLGGQVPPTLCGYSTSTGKEGACSQPDPDYTI